jgi:hypothetical protein
VLAYVFWHRPAPGTHDYERRLTAFHDVIGVESTWHRVTGLPWMGGLDGYEDWYLVDDWAGLGALNERAISGPRRAPHDAAAADAQWGQAGVYALKRGRPELHHITHAAWRTKPPGLPHAAFEARLPGRSVWQRQMTLGPTPEYVLLDVQAIEGDPGVEYT